MTWWWSRPRIGRGELDRCAYHGLADDLPDPPKSRSTAFALSAGGTALSIGLVAAGATTHNGPMLAAGLLGSLALPSAGEMNGGKLVTLGMGLRAGSAILFLLGVGESVQCFFAENTCGAAARLFGGALGYGTGIIYDIATAATGAEDVYGRHSSSRAAHANPVAGTITTREGSVIAKLA